MGQKNSKKSKENCPNFGGGRPLIKTLGGVLLPTHPGAGPLMAAGGGVRSYLDHTCANFLCSPSIRGWACFQLESPSAGGPPRVSWSTPGLIFGGGTPSPSTSGQPCKAKRIQFNSRQDLLTNQHGSIHLPACKLPGLLVPLSNKFQQNLSE